MNQRKLFISLFTGVIALASISFSFSLAWYATSSRLNVDALEITVKGSPEIKISTKTDADSFVERLEKDKLDQVGLFAPCSTMFESRWHTVDAQAPEFYEYSGFFTPASGEPYAPNKVSQGLYSQSLYLKANDDVYASIDPLTTFFDANEEENLRYASLIQNQHPDMTPEEIAENLNKLVNALRVSFYVVEDGAYTIFDPYKNGITYYGGILDNDKDGYFDTYYDYDSVLKEVVYGEIRNRDAIVHKANALADDEKPVDGVYNCFSANHGKGVRPYDEAASLANGMEIAEEQSLTYADFNGNRPEDNGWVVTLERNVPKEVVVSIYLEGWDHDCINSTMGASFLAEIQFKILREV